MAKRGRGTRSNKRVKGDAWWKRSKALAATLFCAIIAIWGYTLKTQCFGGGTGPKLEDFPYTYMAEKSRKVYVRPADSGKQPRVPYKDAESGKLLWECYVCTNPDCPYLRSRKNKKKRQYKFPHVIKELLKKQSKDDKTKGSNEMRMQMQYMMMYPQCPKCKKSKTYGGMVERYQTKEGKEKLEKLRAEYMKKYKEKKKKK